ncbi:MAG: hypothetical protein QXY49_03415 [Thermofilaceae archaeon]
MREYKYIFDSEVISIPALLLLLYSLTIPWFILKISSPQFEYKPSSLFEQLAQGKVNFFEQLTRLLEHRPEGRQLILYFSTHVVLLIIATVLAIYSIITNSTNGYIITAILAILSVVTLNIVVNGLAFADPVTTDAGSVIFALQLYLSQRELHLSL